MAVPAFVASTELGLPHGIGWDAFFFDEFFELDRRLVSQNSSSFAEIRSS